MGSDIYVTTDNMEKNVEKQAIAKDAPTWLGVLYLVVKIIRCLNIYFSSLWIS